MSETHGIRALLVTTDFPPEVGGLQTYAYRIARDLPGGLLAHVLIGSDHPPADLSFPRAGEIGYTCRRGSSRLRALAWSLAWVPRLRKRLGINVLLHMQWSTAIPSWLLSKVGAGVPYVVLIHGAELLDPGRFLVNRLKAAVFRSAAAVVAGSDHTAELFSALGLRSRQLMVIPYGNPLEGEGLPGKPGAGEAPQAPPSRPAAPAVARLLCMHRLVPRKGTALLLEALSGLQKLTWILDIIGDGEEKPALQKLTKKLGLAGRVHFHDPVDTAGKILRLSQASLFILPSLPPDGNNHVEGLGLTLLEAQGLGIAVLAARTGGIPEAVQEGRTGLLFKPGNVADLREKLALLLSSPDTLAFMGRAGPGWVRARFSWHASLKRLAEVMEEIAKRN